MPVDLNSTHHGFEACSSIVERPAAIPPIASAHGVLAPAECPAVSCACMEGEWSTRGGSTCFVFSNRLVVALSCFCCQRHDLQLIRPCHVLPAGHVLPVGTSRTKLRGAEVLGCCAQLCFTAAVGKSKQKPEAGSTRKPAWRAMLRETSLSTMCTATTNCSIVPAITLSPHDMHCWQQLHSPSGAHVSW